MTTEQKLEIVKKAIELGASVDIHFHSVISESQARKIAGEIGLEFKACYGDSSFWLKHDRDDEGFGISIFYQKIDRNTLAKHRKELLSELEKLEDALCEIIQS